MLSFQKTILGLSACIATVFTVAAGCGVANAAPERAFYVSIGDSLVSGAAGAVTSAHRTALPRLRDGLLDVLGGRVTLDSSLPATRRIHGMLRRSRDKKRLPFT